MTSDGANHIPFNRAFRTGREARFIEEALENGHLAADGPFTERCKQWLEERTGTGTALLTHSATAALEASAILTGAGPGDEVIMPSFTFVTTATAFVLRGATPVFVDIREDTLNIDEHAVAAAITPRTKAIVAVHYAGVACELRALRRLAAQAGIPLVEDAAQAVMSTYHGQSLGAVGTIGALSFHETKNVTCGEGGALLVNDLTLVERAQIVRDKGTNRKQFWSGKVDKYTWHDLGSSFAMSELNAAFLWAQLQEAEQITARRLSIWARYHEAFGELEAEGRLRRPSVPAGCVHNGHMYYLLVPDLEARTEVLERLAVADIGAVFHYIPLHSSPAGMRYGRAVGDLRRTTELSERLIRLPMWAGMTPAEVDRVIAATVAAVHAAVPEQDLAEVTAL